MVPARLGQVWATGSRKLPAGGPTRAGAGQITPERRGLRSRRWGHLCALAAFTGMLFLGAGCSTSGLSHDRLGAATPHGSVRTSAMETSRLLSNAHYYKLMGRPDAALKELEEAHRQDPDNLKILDALAQNYQELGYLQRAQELYQEALAHHGANRALRNNFCFSYYLQGQLAKAESCFQETLARDPGNAAARNNLGLIWCREGRLADAQRLWQEAEGPEGAQQRLHQALAFLGMKAPTAYARQTEPEARPSRAASQPPTATAQPAAVAAPTPKATVTPTVAATPPAAREIATKPLGPKPTPVSRQLAAKPSVASVPPVAPSQPAALKTPTEKEAVSQAAAAPPPPAENKLTARALEPKPATSPPSAAQTQRPAPISPAAPAKPAAVVAQVPPAAVSSTPPVVMTPRSARKATARLAKLKRTAAGQKEAAATPDTSVTLISSTKPMPVTAPTGEQPAPKAASAPPPPIEKKLIAKAPESKPSTMPSPAPPVQPPGPLTPAPPAKAAALAAPVPPAATTSAPTVVAAPQAAGKEAAAPAASPILTAPERLQAGIEIRNGVRKRNLAHLTRSMLAREGFKVVQLGNHINFGAKSTVIYYRPNEEKVARVLKSEFFPEARIEPSSSLKHSIKIVLGRDLLDRPQVMARLAGKKMAPAPPTVIAQALKTEPSPQPAAPEKRQAPAAPVVPTQSESGPPPVKTASGTPAAPVAAAIGAQQPVQVEANHSTVLLTAYDLVCTIIEIRNGAGSRNLAHRTRSLLSEEGFNVGIIGNHIDFGAGTTVIYYRPRAEKVARALQDEFFPTARLEQSSRLIPWVDVKVILGHDLLARPRIMARLVQE